jgi:hypothetical protein
MYMNFHINFHINLTKNELTRKCAKMALLAKMELLANWAHSQTHIKMALLANAYKNGAARKLKNGAARKFMSPSGSFRRQARADRRGSSRTGAKMALLANPPLTGTS